MLHKLLVATPQIMFQLTIIAMSPAMVKIVEQAAINHSRIIVRRQETKSPPESLAIAAITAAI